MYLWKESGPFINQAPYHKKVGILYLCDSVQIGTKVIINAPDNNPRDYNAELASFSRAFLMGDYSHSAVSGKKYDSFCIDRNKSLEDAHELPIIRGASRVVSAGIAVVTGGWHPSGRETGLKYKNMKQILREEVGDTPITNIHIQ